MAHLFGKFVWFEHMSADLAGARKFYGELFGWRSEGMPMGGQTYHMIQNGSDGIGGYRAAPSGVPSHWVAYLSVPDVDAACQTAERAGGKVLMPPTDFPPVGRGAALTDPTGAAFSVWNSSQGDRADTATVAAGDWYWNELWTQDAKKALGFYEGVFGYSYDTMDMGPQGTYYMLKKDGIPRGGLMQAHDSKVPSMWLPYVRVADCDGSTSRAQQLGAKVIVPPTDIPEVGRFAVLLDSTGAAVAIIKGQR